MQAIKKQRDDRATMKHSGSGRAEAEVAALVYIPKTWILCDQLKFDLQIYASEDDPRLGGVATVGTIVSRVLSGTSRGSLMCTSDSSRRETRPFVWNEVEHGARSAANMAFGP